MIDDTMTTGMLNSFNSGAFQISCLRWARPQYDKWCQLRTFIKEIMMMQSLMKILTDCKNLSAKVYQHVHWDGGQLQGESSHPVGSGRRRLWARAAQEARLQVWKPERATSAGARHLGPELYWGMCLRPRVKKMKGVVRKLCGVEWVPTHCTNCLIGLRRRPKDTSCGMESGPTTSTLLKCYLNHLLTY